MARSGIQSVREKYGLGGGERSGGFSTSGLESIRSIREKHGLEHTTPNATKEFSFVTNYYKTRDALDARPKSPKGASYVNGVQTEYGQLMSRPVQGPVNPANINFLRMADEAYDYNTYSTHYQKYQGKTQEELQSERDRLNQVIAGTERRGGDPTNMRNELAYLDAALRMYDYGGLLETTSPQKLYDAARLMRSEDEEDQRYGQQLWNNITDPRYVYGWLNPDAEYDSNSSKMRSRFYQENLDRLVEIEKRQREIIDSSQNGGNGNFNELYELNKEAETLRGENQKYEDLQRNIDKYVDIDTSQVRYPHYNNPTFEEALEYVKSNDPNVGFIRALSGQTGNSEVEDKLSFYRGLTEEQRRELEGAGRLYGTVMTGSSENTVAPDQYAAGYDKISSIMKEAYENDWDYLTEDEIKIYYTLFQQQGRDAAYQYLDDMKVELNRRREREDTKKTADWASQGWGYAAAASVASIPFNLMGGLESYADDLGHMLAGERINPYSHAHASQNIASTIRGTVSSNIDEATKNKKLLGMSFGDIYQAGMSTADSLTGTLMPPGVYGTMMGMGAASAKARELYERGASNEQIFAGSMLSGAAELLFEELSIDKLKIMAVNDPKSLKEFVLNILKQSFTEGSEEFLTEIANTLIEDLNMGALSDTNQKFREYVAQGYSENEARAMVVSEKLLDVWKATASGMISGGINASGVQTLSYAGNKINNVQFRKFNTAAITSAIGEENKAEAKVLANVDSGKTVSLQDAERVLNNESSMQFVNSTLQIDTEDIKTAEELRTALNEYATGVKIAEDVAQKISEEKTVTEKDVQQIANNKTAQRSFEQLLNAPEGSLSTPEAIQNAVDNVTSGRKATASREGVQTTEYSGKTEENIREASRNETRRALNTENVSINPAEAIVGDRNVQVHDIADAKAGTVYLDDGSTASLSNVAFDNRDMAALYNYAASHYDTTTANILVNGYNGNENYFGAFDHYYQAGLSGNSFSYANDHVYSLYINRATAEQAFAHGRDAMRAEQAEAVKQQKNRTVKEAEGGVYYSENISTDKTQITQDQRRNLDVLKEVANKTKQRIAVVDSLSDGKGLINGRYDSKTDTITIALDAFDGAYMYWAGHEIVHRIKNQSAERYAQLRNIVLESLEKQKGFNLDSRVRNLQRTYRRVGQNLTRPEAIEEIVANSVATVFADEQTVQEITAKNRTLAENVREILTEFINKIKDTIRSISKYMPEGQAMLNDVKALEKARDVLTAALKETEGIREAEQVQKTVEKVGVEIDTATESAAPSDIMLSYNTWMKSDFHQNQQEAAEALAQSLDITVEKALKYIHDIDSVAYIIASDKTRLDYEANDIFTMIKSDQEYKFTVDASTLCAKRRIFTGTMDAIQRQLKNAVLTAEDRVRIRDMMMKKGYEVACGICYVESSRKDSGPKAQRFIDAYKSAQKSGESIKYESASGAVHEVMVDNKAAFASDYVPTQYDLNTTEGIDALQKNHPDVYKAYIAYMNRMGQSKPKMLETRTEYRGEIAKFRQSMVDYLNNHGGLRLQSYSDFETPHLIDMMQVVLDMSQKGLKSQAYTKIPNFAKVFGGTGVKINLSLIAKGSGLDANGNLIFDDVEGMPHEEAFAIRDRFSKNVGTILVGKNDAHIIAAMADPRIDFIIPFHKSQWNQSLYEALGLTGYSDYTSFQNEKGIDGSTVKNYDPSEYWDFSKTGDENAQIYLEKCREEGRIPKFPQFSHYPGYWKLLIDFKMYDNNGVGSPQKAVQPNFQMDEANRVLEEYEGGANSFPVAQEVVDQFVSEYKYSANELGASEQIQEETGIRYSLIEDKDLIRELDNQDHITVYRAMQLIGGKLYPPMAAKVGKNLVDATEIGKWYQSDERPDLIKNGKFTLNKGNGSSIAAAYNPYFHTSASPLNDQFSSAYKRPNLVVVEGVIPKSELTSGYKAEGAKDAVGETKWHAGPVASKLKGDKARRVFLSRYFKAERIVSDAEVARTVASILEGENITIPRNVVTPSLLRELRNHGVQIEGEQDIRYSININMTDDERYEELKNSVVYAPTYSAKDNIYSEEIQTLEQLEKKAKSKAESVIYPLAKKLKILSRPFTNRQLEVTFEFTKSGGLKESLSQQLNYGGDYSSFAKALINLDGILQGAELIEQHIDKYKGTVRENIQLDHVSVLFGAYRDGEYIIPVQFEIKHYTYDPNGKLYMTVSLAKIKETSVLGNVEGENSMQALLPVSIISLSDIINNVNTVDERFLKYIPNQMLSNEQIEAKNHAMAEEKARIEKYPKKLSINEIDQLREDLKSSQIREDNLSATIKQQEEVINGLREQFQLTEGHKLSQDKIDRLAKSIVKKYSSEYDAAALSENLGKLFDYIANGENLDWDSVMEVSSSIAKRVLSESSVLNREMYDQYKDMRDYFRNQRITIPQEIRSEVGEAYGGWNNLRRELFGKVNLTNDGRSLDSMWNEITGLWPEFFDADTTEQGEISQVIDALQAIQPYFDNPFGMNMDEAAYDLAQELYESYFNIPEVKTFADKQQQKLEKTTAHMSELRENEKQRIKDRYEKKLSDLRKQKSEQLDALRERYQKAIGQEKEEYRQRIEKLRAQKNEQLMKQYARLKTEKWEAVQRQRDLRQSAYYKGRINRILQEFNQRLLSPTKDKHIPSSLIRSMVEVCEIMNGAYDNEKAQVALSRLQTAYGEMRAHEGSEENPFFDPVMADIAHLRATLQERQIRELSVADLKDVYDVLKEVRHVVNTYNKAFIEGRRATISGYATDVMGEMNRVRKNKPALNYKLLDMVKSFGWSNLKPIYAMRMIGSDTFTDLYHNLRAGEDKWYTNVNRVRDVLTNARRKYGAQSWDMKKTKTFQLEGGGSITLDLGHMMSLYALYKRQQAVAHMEQGGVVLDSESSEKKGSVKYKTTANPVRVSFKDIQNIVESMTDNQIAYVDELQKYLAVDMAELGNEVTKALYDIEKFTDPNYFPIKSSSDFIYNAQDKKDAAPKIINSSFTKDVVRFANNPVVISDFTDVWADHCNQMCMYNAMTLPLEDFTRVFNFKTQADGLAAPISVKTTLTSEFGGSNDATMYIERLLRDVNGGVTNPGGSSFVNRMTSLFKKGAVFASASVVVQQPSAIARAMAMVDPKYFLKTSFRWNSYNELKKWAPIAGIKEMGYFDTGISRGPVEWITKSDPKGLREKVKAFFTDGNYRDELISFAPQKADAITWSHLWEACKAEQMDKHGFKKGSDELMQAAAKRFTEVVERTQVYDSVFSRSEMMRSKDASTKMVTAFMAEPTTSMNMLLDGFVQGKRNGMSRKGWGYASRALGAFVSSVVLNSILKSFVTAARDDDDDKSYWEKYLGNVVGNIKDDLNPLGLIPIARDIVSIFQGYNVNRADMSLFEDLAKNYKKVQGILDGGEVSADAIMNFVGSVAAFAGLPVKNIWRDVKAALNIKADIERGKKTDWDGIVYSIAQELGYDMSYKALANQMMSGDDRAEFTRKMILRSGKTEDKIDTETRKYLKTDEMFREYGERYAGGDLSALEEAIDYYESRGFNGEDVASALRTYADKDINGMESSYTQTVAGTIYQYDDLYSAMDNDKKEDITKVVNAIVDGYTAGGKTLKEAKSTIRSQLTKNYKEQYIDADEKERLEIRRRLYMTSVYDSMEALDKILAGWLK